MVKGLVLILMPSLCFATSYTNQGQARVPIGPTFVVSRRAEITTVNTEVPAYLIVNLATNTVNAEYMTLGIDDFYSKAGETTIRAYVNPVISSSGTAITAVNVNTGSSQKTQIQFFKLPTSSSFGTPVEQMTVGTNADSVSKDFRIILATGTKMLFTAYVTAATSSTLTTYWTETKP